ncbi:hypothetical protein DSM14862_02214 [Sulfitobacter indolifex]|nr:hypothetical protein DSM14862_02214 [Sulfitobacter indolifex]
MAGTTVAVWFGNQLQRFIFQKSGWGRRVSKWFSSRVKSRRPQRRVSGAEWRGAGAVSTIAERAPPTGDRAGRAHSSIKVTSAEILVEFSKTCLVQHANEEACGVTYGLGDSLIGEYIADLFGPRLSDGAEISTLLLRIVQGKQQYGCFEMLPGEETARIVEGQFTPMLGPGGEVCGIRFTGAGGAANSPRSMVEVAHGHQAKRALPH